MPIARYAITSGLAGLYMPDNHSGAYQITSRRELASIIRNEIDMADFPKSTFEQVRIRNLWAFIRRHGSSSAHFRITHQDREIAFHGLTEAEYAGQFDDE